MACITVQMMQMPAVSIDGNSVAFPFKRVDALLYYMLCRKTATRHEVVSLLWENHDEESGYKNLRHAIYVLKRTLGEEVLISPQKSTLKINPEIEISCDYDQFLQSEEPSAYKGQFLQGFTVKNAPSFEEWVERTREKLRESYLQRIAIYAHKAADAEDFLRAEQGALDYLREDPMDERMAAFLIRLYGGMALYHKAAKTYQRFKQCIADELGIAPLSETTALYYEMMNRWNDTAGPEEEEPVPPPPDDELLATLAACPDGEETPQAAFALLERRMSGLAIQSRQVADIISLFEDEAPCEMLSEITDKSAPELLSIYEELKQRNLVIEHAVTPADAALSFTHPKIRDMIYANQPYFKRRTLHLRVARFLERKIEQADACGCQSLAYHFEQGGDALHALGYKVRALELFGRYAHESPSVLPPESVLPFDLATYAEEILRLEERLAKLRRHAEDPIALDRMEGELLCAKGRWHIYAGNYSQGVDALELLRAHPVHNMNTELMITVHRLLAGYALQIGDMELADTHVFTGTALAEQAVEDLSRAQYLLLKGQYYARMAEHDKSNYYLFEAIDNFGRLRESHSCLLFVAAAYNWLGEGKRRQKDFAGACTEYKKAMTLVMQAGPRPGSAPCLVGYARAAHELGDGQKAEELLTQACGIYNVTDELVGQAIARGYLALYLAQKGLHQEAAESLRRAKKAAERLASPTEAGVLYGIMAQLRKKLDMERNTESPLNQLLHHQLEIYARRGIKVLERIPGFYELEALQICLRYAVTKARPFTVPELYSKNKRFMTE